MPVSGIIEKFLEKFKSIQEAFLDYLKGDENIEESYNNLEQIFEDTKIRESKHDVELFLHILVKVANNRHRCPNFYNKIDRILQFFKDDLKKCKNEEIFQLFKSNKRILLFLIEEKILTVDVNFVKKIISKKYLEKFYPLYFAPEINPFLNEQWFPKKNDWFENITKKLPDDFYKLRKIGENESYICELIRKDMVEDFIAYLNRGNISRNAIISQSIFETNSFLIKKHENIDEQSNNNYDIKGTTLIEYAAFFGSIQIFTYLKYEGVELTPSLWLSAIHGKNAELIRLLEDNHVKLHPECIEESIICHHNEIADYFLNNYPQNKAKKSSEAIIRNLKYYNFAFLQKENINKSSFRHLCHYDYYTLVAILLANREMDINDEVIQNHIYE